MLGKSLPVNQEQEDFSFRRAISQLGAGFISGFTTIQIGEQPTNTIEGIARSVGQLAGFVGYIPGPGLAGRVGMSAVGRAMGLGGMKSLAGLPARLNVKSVPMAVADRVVRSVERLSPEASAIKFLGEKGQDMVREGVRLGTASATSAWQGGIDSMLQAGALGAFEGSVFRGVANIVNTGDRMTDKVIRGVSSSLFAGLPTTLNDDPLEMQVYQYLLGAYFGSKDLPLSQMKAMQFVERGISGQDPINATALRLSPQKIAGFDDLPKDVKNEVMQESIATAGRVGLLDDGTSFTSATAVMNKGIRDAFGGIDEASADRIRKASAAYYQELDAAMRETGDFEVAIDRAGRKSYEAFSSIEDVGRDVIGERTRLHDEFAVISKMAGDETDPMSFLDNPLREIGTRSQVDTDEFVGAARDRLLELAREVDNPQNTRVDDPTIMDEVEARIKALDDTLDVSGDRSKLRLAFKTLMGRRKVEEGFIDASGAIVTGAEVTDGGKRIARFSHESMLDKTDSILYLKHRTVINESGKTESVTPFDERNPMAFEDLAGKLWEMGRIPLAGIKAKGSVAAIPNRLLEEAAMGREAAFENDGTQFTEKGLADITEHVRGLHEATGDRDNYTALKKDFVDDLASRGIDKIGNLTTDQYYDVAQANNIHFLEKMNGGVSYKEMVARERESKGSFVLDSANLNKRMQVYGDSAYAMSPAWYGETRFREGGQSAQELGGIPYVIVRGVREKAIAQRLAHLQQEPHTDGAMLMHHELFDRMVEEGGLDPETGRMKASIAYGNEQGGQGQLGGFLGKLAVVRLDPAESAELSKVGDNGVGFVIMDSAVKQRGYRKQYDYSISKKGGLRILEEGSDARVPATPEVYTAPFDGIRLNPASSEHVSKQLGKVLVPLQSHTVIDDPVVAHLFFEQWIRPSIDGNEHDTARYLKGDLNGFQADRLALYDLIRTATNPQTQNKVLFDRVWRAILGTKARELDIANSKVEDVDGDLDANDRIVDKTTQEREIRALLNTGQITPAALFGSKSLHNFAMSSLVRYTKSRVMKPVTDNGGIAIMGPQDGFFQRWLADSFKDTATPLYGDKKLMRSLKNGEVPDGYFMLGPAARERMVKGKGKEKVKLGDLYDTYVKTGDKELEDLLTMAVVRVPTDSKAGVRMLKLAGFTRRKGAEIVLSDNEMTLLGGADLDIDKAWWIQDFDNNGTGRGPIRDFFEKNARQWHGQDGKVSDPKEGYEGEFVQSRPDHERSFAAGADPRVAFNTAKASYLGNKAIGSPALATRRVNAIRSRLEQGGVFQGQYKHPSLPVRFKVEATAGNIDGFYKYVRAGLNYAADSANAPLKFGPDGMSRFLASKLFRGEIKSVEYLHRDLDTGEDYYSSKPNGVDQKALDQARADYRVGLQDLNEFGPLFGADKNMRRRDADGNDVNVFDMLDAWRDLGDTPMENTYYRALQEIGSIEAKSFGRQSDLDANGHRRIAGRDGKLVFADPSVVAPWVSPEAIQRLYQEFDPLMRAYDNPQDPRHQEARETFFLAGSVMPPKENGLNYDALYKVQNDINDAVSLSVLPVLGRDALREIGGDNPHAVIRHIQKRWHSPSRLSHPNEAPAFRQRLLKALRLDRSGVSNDGASAESVADVYRDMEGFAEGLSQDHGPATRRYFEMLVRSTAQPQVAIPRPSKDKADKDPFSVHANDVFTARMQKGEFSNFLKKAYDLYANAPREYPRRESYSGDMAHARALKQYRDLYKIEHGDGRNPGLGLFGKDVSRKGYSVENAMRANWVTQAQRDHARTNNTTPALMWPGMSDGTMRDWVASREAVTGYLNAPERAPEPSDTIIDPITKEEWSGYTRENAKAELEVYSLLFGDKTDEVAIKAGEMGLFDKSTAEGRANIKLAGRLSKLLQKHPDITPHISELFQGSTSEWKGVGANPKSALMDDLRIFLDDAEGAINGTLLDKIFKGKKDPSTLHRGMYLFFPDTVARMALRDDIQASQQVMEWVMQPDRIAYKPVRKFFSSVGDMKNVFDVAVKSSDLAAERTRTFYHRLIGFMSNDAIGADARNLFVAATVLRELPLARVVDANGKDVLDKDGNLTYGDDEISKAYRDRYEKHKHIVEKLGNRKYTFRAPVDKKGGGFLRYRDLPKDDPRRVKRQGKKEEKFNENDFVLEARTFTGKDLFGSVDDPQSGIINRALTNHNIEMKRWLRNDRAERKWVIRDVDDGVDLDATIEKLRGHILRRKEIPTIGVEALSKIAYEQELRNVVKIGPGGETLNALKAAGALSPKEYRTELKKLRAKHPYVYTGVNPYESHSFTDSKSGERIEYAKRKSKTRASMIGELDVHTYFPHANYDRKSAEAWVQKIEAAYNEADISPADRMRYKLELNRRFAKGILPESAFTIDTKDILMQGDLGGSDYAFVRPDNAMARSDKYLMPGWDPTEQAYLTYNQSLTRGHNSLAGAILAQDSIFRTKYDNSFGESTGDWIQWQKVYLNNFLGHSTMFPNSMLEGRSKIRNSAAYFSSDRMAWDLYKKVGRFIGGKTREKIERIEQEARGAKMDETKHPEVQRMGGQLRRVSNFEGKAQLMTLLANTRTMINNHFGGNAMTIASTGLRPWLRTFSLKHMQQINPEWKTHEDVRQFAMEGGAIESYIVKDVNLSGGIFDKENAKAFKDDALALIKKNPDVEDTELIRIARRHSLGKEFVDAAAWFMRKSERDLRYRSFMAHYMAARDMLGESSMTAPIDDPRLVDLARRGVEATQFLYHSTARPQFAASSLGKVFARFQLWSWNSVRFRKSVYQKARTLGFKPGTKDFERFKRTTQADFFMFGLAAALPYTMFEAALPQPMGWLKDLGEFFFGDNEEREDAFFGVLPYPLNVTGVVLPPSSRIFTAMGALMGGDMERFLNYHLYTFVPFGLMVRNTKNVVQNPAFAAEYLAGVPLHKMTRELNKRKKQDSESPWVPDQVLAA